MLVFIAGANAATGPKTADDYLIQGVTVDVQGSSALDARDKAYAAARRMAYQQLAQRMLPAREQANIVIPDDKMIASAIRDFSIKNEKMTSRHYAGTVDIRFTPAAAKRVMQAVQSGAAVPVTGDDTIITGSDATPEPQKRRGEDAYTAPRRIPAAMPANTVLVLPWYSASGRSMLWGQNNPWRAAWEEKNGLSADRSMVLPVGDVNDMRAYSPAQPLSQGGDIDALMRRYQAKTAVLAMAEPQDDGSVQVMLYRYTNNAATPVGRFSVDGSSHDPMGDAVSKATAALKGLPASDNTPAPMQVSVEPGSISTPQMGAVTTGTYRTLAKFSGLQEWVAMRQALNRVPGMGPVSVHSISPSQANIEFDYKGNAGMLMQAFAQNGLQISTIPQGTVVAGGPGDVPPQFLLNMGRAF